MKSENARIHPWLKWGSVILASSAVSLSACSKKKSGDNGSNPIAETARQHKADQCPVDLAGDYKQSGPDSGPDGDVTLKVEEGVYVIESEGFRLPVNGEVVKDDSDKTENVAICEGGNIEMAVQGPDIDFPKYVLKKTDIGIDLELYNTKGEKEHTVQYERKTVAQTSENVQASSPPSQEMESENE